MNMPTNCSKFVPGGMMRITDRSEESVKAFLAAASKYPRLTADEERTLGLLARSGDEQAIQRLICCNLRLCVTVANDWTGYDVPFNDIIGAAREGLCIAARKFDPDRGRFSVYASQWMKDCIRKLLNEDTVVSLPINAPKVVKAILERKNEVALKLNMDEELVTEDDLWDDYEDEQEKMGESPDISYAVFKGAINAPKNFERFVAPNERDSEDSPYYVDLASDGEDPYNVIFANGRAQALHEALEQLTDDVRRTLQLLYGIGCKEHKAKDVARIMGVSEQTVRNRVKSGRKKLALLLGESPWAA